MLTKMHTTNICKKWGAVLLITLCFFGSMDRVSAQRVSWGVMWNGATVPIPDVIRYRILSTTPPGSRGVPSIGRSAATALIGGWGFHTYTRLYEFNPDLSMGVMANPMIAVYFPADFGSGFDYWAIFDVFDLYGIPVMLQMPLMLQFAGGMMSTNSSSKDIGWAISAGVEGSLFTDRYVRRLRGNAQYDLPDLSWVRPAAAAHLRYWNRNNKARELSFQFSTHRDNYTGEGVLRPMYKISYGAYWNY